MSLPIPELTRGKLSQFDSAWTPNAGPEWAGTKVPAMALSPDEARAGGRTGGVGVGARNWNMERGGNRATT